MSTMKIAVRRVGSMLTPVGKVAGEHIEKMNPNVSYMAEIKRPRNLPFHALYWGMCARLADALNDGPDGKEGEVNDANTVDYTLRVATGYFELIELSAKTKARISLPSNKEPVLVKLRSISFAKMDQEAFRTFVEACMSHVREVLAPWLDDELATAKVWEPIREILKGK